MSTSITGSLIFIPATFTLFFGVWVLLKNPKSRVNRGYFGIIISLLVWSTTLFVFLVFPHNAEALNFWLNMNFIGPSIFISMFVYFSYVFPENERPVSWSEWILIFSPVIFFSPLAFLQIFALGIADLHSPVEWSYLAYLFFTILLVYASWATYNFINKLKKERGVSDRRAMFIFFSGLLIAFVFAFFFTVYLPVISKDHRFLFVGPSLGGLFIAVFTSYAIVRYDLMEIKIVAKRALFYAVTVASITIFLSVVVLVSRFFEDSYPKLSVGLIPAVFSTLAVLLGVYIWRGMKTSESLKYEFLTTITHKFRTPLTRVKWAVDDLRDPAFPEDQRDARLDSIDTAAQNVLEIVNLLTTVSNERNALRDLSMNINVSEILKELLEKHKKNVSDKGLVLVESVEDGVFVFADDSRVKFLMNALVDNAVRYTPSGGKINVALSSEGDKVYFWVKDTGIGMDNGIQDLVFSTFFRGEKARLEDTEGMGVGLYIAKRIADEMGGEMGFRSAGEGKGSFFFFKIPLSKKVEAESSRTETER